MKTTSSAPASPRAADASTACAHRAAETAAERSANAEFSGWYLSSFELREGLTVIHLDELPPQAMFA